MERLAEAIKLAAKIREESYDKEAAQSVLGMSGITNFSKFYKISLAKASGMAAEQVGFDTRGTLPIYLLLKKNWNDILDWAELFDNKM